MTSYQFQQNTSESPKHKHVSIKIPTYHLHALTPTGTHSLWTQSDIGTHSHHTSGVHLPSLASKRHSHSTHLKLVNKNLSSACECVSEEAQ